jgi:hypothetical protein
VAFRNGAGSHPAVRAFTTALHNAAELLEQDDTNTP